MKWCNHCEREKPLDQFYLNQYGNPCGRYRYRLSRWWPAEESLIDGQRDLGAVAFLMLNPSTADAETFDPTVRRCYGYARAWGYTELHVINLFALRSTDPQALYRAGDPVGPENDDRIRTVVSMVDRVVLAYGKHGRHMGRDAAVIEMLQPWREKLVCLHRNIDGTPGHPLYLKNEARVMSFYEAGKP